MTEIRDMRDIAKADLLADVLREAALKYYKEFHEDINSRSSNPAYMMEWADGLFEAAAKWKFYGALADACRARAGDLLGQGEPLDTTMEQLQQFAQRYWQPRGRHHGSSVSRNNLNSHLDEVVLDLIWGRNFSWFRAAQAKDPEWQAWRQQETDRQIAASKRLQAARDRVRSRVNRGAAPSVRDLVMGWPNGPEGVRNPKLAGYIEAAHIEHREHQLRHKPKLV